MPESGAQEAGGAGGEQNGSRSGGERDADNRSGHMNRRDIVDFVGAGAGALTILFLALHAFSPLPEPWRTIMGAAALAVAVLSVARFGWNMLGRKRQEDRLDAMERRLTAKLDAILDGQKEIIRLLGNIADELARIRKST